MYLYREQRSKLEDAVTHVTCFRVVPEVRTYTGIRTQTSLDFHSLFRRKTWQCLKSGCDTSFFYLSFLYS
jgi:hypothetical protein